MKTILWSLLFFLPILATNEGSLTELTEKLEETLGKARLIYGNIQFKQIQRSKPLCKSDRLKLITIKHSLLRSESFCNMTGVFERSTVTLQEEILKIQKHIVQLNNLLSKLNPPETILAKFQELKERTEDNLITLKKVKNEGDLKTFIEINEIDAWITQTENNHRKISGILRYIEITPTLAQPDIFTKDYNHFNLALGRLELICTALQGEKNIIE